MFQVNDDGSRPGCPRRSENAEMNSTLPLNDYTSKWVRDSSLSGSRAVGGWNEEETNTDGRVWGRRYCGTQVGRGSTASNLTKSQA